MTSTEQPTSQRWLRRAAWITGGLLGLWGLTWLAVPPLTKHLIETQASEQLGRAVTVGSVDFRPWTLELTVTDIAVAGAKAADGAGSAPPQFQVQRLYIDVELQSLLRLAPVVDAVQLDAPVLRLTHRGEGRYDIDDILAKLGEPPSPPDAPASDPLRFALYNLALQGGALDFTDDTVKTTHRLRDLTLTLPFLSNFDSQREVKVAPRVAFVLNGSHFDTAAEATPFAQTRKTDATLQFSGFDLAPYLGYLPAGLPVALQAGVVDADVQIAFQQTPVLAVKLSGTLNLNDVRLADARAQELLAFDALQLTLADVQPLAQVAKFSRVALNAPRLVAQRDAAGRLNLQLGGPENATEKGAKPRGSAKAEGKKDLKSVAQAASGAVSGASAASGTAKTASGGWLVAVDTFQLRDGAVRWRDQTTQPTAQLALRDLTLDADRIAWPLVQPLAFKGAVALAAPTVESAPATSPPVKGARPRLEKAGPAAAAASKRQPPGAAAGTRPSGQLAFSGTATDAQAQVQASVSGVPLTLAGPYLAAVLRPQLQGQLDAELALQWQPAGLQVSASKLALSDLALTDGPNPPLVALRQGVLTDTVVDLARQDVRIGQLRLVRPQAGVSREADGRWMFERWLVAASDAPAVAPTTPTRAAKPWTVALAELGVADGAVSYRDSSRTQPVALSLSGLALQLKQLGLGQPPGRSRPSPLSVAGRVAADGNEPGRFSYNGSLGLSPLAAQGQVEVVRLPLHAFEPYFGDALNIELLRADASFKGTVRYSDAPAGATLQAAGDAAVDGLRAVGAATAVATPGSAAGTGVVANEDILSWQSLSLRGLDVALAPGVAPSVQLAESTLTDYFARIVVGEGGRINLQNLTKAGSQASAAAAAAPKTGAPSPDTTRADGQTPSPSRSNEAAAGPAADPLAPVIRIGPVNLVNGRVDFSDRFIQPNYSANLTELSGRLSAFASVAPGGGQPPLADLELRGRAEGSASLEVTGQLNPLAQPLALDITGKVRELELPPLSPYAIKYAGYGIERGKLSLDVNYKVQPNGQLTASNKFVLNQLLFGEKVAGAPNSLPVKLAVALLADRNGVIDINLPISGSLNDPQFSIGPIILKAIVNLIVKAVTSPFSLLASAVGGGGDELSSVNFLPGSALLGNQARQGLDKVAKALADRPALTMTVVGSASLSAERDALRRDQLQQRVLAEKRRTSTRTGAAQAMAFTAAEYPALLTEVYKRAEINKPRNALGFAKELPVAEMEALLLANMPVGEEQVRALAAQRAAAVRDYLMAQKLPADRLFLGASKTGPVDASWRPRAELNLALP